MTDFFLGQNEILNVRPKGHSAVLSNNLTYYVFHNENASYSRQEKMLCFFFYLNDFVVLRLPVSTSLPGMSPYMSSRLSWRSSWLLSWTPSSSEWTTAARTVTSLETLKVGHAGGGPGLRPHDVSLISSPPHPVSCLCVDENGIVLEAEVSREEVLLTLELYKQICPGGSNLRSLQEVLQCMERGGVRNGPQGGLQVQLLWPRLSNVNQ